jgi:hypothetical protein
MLTPNDSVLGFLSLGFSKLSRAYPTQSKMAMVDLQFCGWQSLLGHRVGRVPYVCLVLLMAFGWPPRKLPRLPYLDPSHFSY